MSISEQMLLSQSGTMVINRLTGDYGERSITVSTARLVVDGDTYSLANVASCRIRKTNEIDDGKLASKQLLKSLGWIAVAAGILGGAILYFVSSEVMGYLVGILGIGGGIGLWTMSARIDPTFTLYHLLIGASTGEQDPLITPDE